MIRKISLKKFGKFEKKEFNFSDVTVFYGKNESGKTTIFDSLMIKLTEIKGNETEAKKLQRYGKYDREKDIVLDIDTQEKIPTEVFKNILAIRAGEISLELGNKKFSDEISNKIVASEINLGALKVEIDKKANIENSKLLLNKEKKKLEGDYKKTLEEIRGLKNKIEENEELETELKRLSEELKHNEKKYDEKKAKITEIDNKINNITKIQELRNISENLKKIIEYQELEENLNKNKNIDEKEIDEISTKERNLLSLEKECELKEKSLKELKNKITLLEEKIKSLPSNKFSLEDLENIEYEIETLSKKSTSDFIYIISSIVLIFITIFLAVVIKNPFLLAFLSLGIVPIVTLFYNKKVLSLKKDQILNKMPELKNKSFEGIKAELVELKLQLNKNTILIEGLKNDFEESKSREKELQEEIENLGIEKLTFEKEIKDFLFSKQVSSIKELYERRTKLDHLKQQLEKLRNEIFSAFSFSDNIEEIKKELIIRKNQMEEEGILLTGYQEEELKKLKKEKEILSKELDQLTKELKEVEKRISEKKGRLSNITESLVKYADLQSEAKKIENRLREIRNMQNAYQKLSMILSEMMNDITLTFRQIAKEISNEYGEFFPHFKDVEISSINDIEKFYIKDKYMEKRSINHLSTGTRDMFIFAFRILLAKKFGIGKFLIFDEPFLALDEERVEKMIEILKKFYDENHWQLIFFTKDSLIKKFILKKFGQLVKIEELE